MSEVKAKGFFERPEGKTGILFIGLAAGGAAYGLYYLLPAIIVLLQNMVYASLLAGGLAAAVFVVADKRFRALVWYMYKSAMRAVTGAFVEIDPIGILRGYVSDLRDKREEMEKHSANLEGQKRKLKAMIDENEAKRKQSLGMAKQAHDRGADYKAAFVLQSRQAGRLQKSNFTLQSLYNKMEVMSKVLKNMRETSDFLLQDIEAEVEVKTAERNAIKASYGAFTAARRIIQGDGDKRELFDQAMEHLANDYAMKVGEIEQFMDMSRGFIQSVDLENGVFEQDALDQLEAWSAKKADQLLLEPPRRIPPSLSSAPEIRSRVMASPTDEEIAQSDSEGAFDDLFQGKK